MESYATVKSGDLVILRGAKNSRAVRVTGEYFFDAENTPLPRDFYNRPLAKVADVLIKGVLVETRVRVFLLFSARFSRWEKR